ncbi:MAG: hypothetical protein Q9M48_02995 [Rhodobacterales bacterium]|nr:hypothetical protein [Rhodobacterales bacterium]
MTHVSTLHSGCTPTPTTNCAATTAKRVSLASRLAHLLRTFEQRAALARLDHARLCDIGVTPEDAQTESRRALWDVPAHWRN